MVATGIGVVALRLGLRPVLSGSMRPAFAPGALLVTRQVPADRVRPGDVIVFHPPNGAGDYAHRVTAVDPPGPHPVVTTKGDANPAADPWHAELLGDTVPVVVASLPGAGRVVAAAQRPALRSALVLVAGLVVLVVGTPAILGPRPRRGAHAAPVRPRPVI